MIFLVGWYVVSPPIIWLGDKYFELTMRAMTAREQMKAFQSAVKEGSLTPK